MMNRMRHMIVTLTSFALCASAAVTLTGCNDAQAGALIGAGVGAGAGAIIGHQSGHAGEGAAIGAGAGALGGYIVGNESDKKKAKESGNYDY